MPECLGSLSDKDGPLSRFLEFHAWSVYAWRPAHVSPPDMPDGFREIRWRYLDPHPDPLGSVREGVTTLRNQRVEVLRQLMGFAEA